MATMNAAVVTSFGEPPHYQKSEVPPLTAVPVWAGIVPRRLSWSTHVPNGRSRAAVGSTHSAGWPAGPMLQFRGPMASAREVGHALARMDDPGAGRASGSDHGAS